MIRIVPEPTISKWEALESVRHNIPYDADTRQGTRSVCNIRRVEQGIATEHRGAIAGYVMRPDTYTGVLIAIAMFETNEAYESNGKDPAQGEWFAKLRAVLQSDPDWEDGEYMVAPK